MSTGAQLDFADFYRREFPRLSRTLRPLVGHAADDVAQEAFLVANARWADVVALDSPYAWVRKVALRIAARHGHRERRRPSLESSWTARAPDGPDLLDLDTIAAVRELPNRHAAAVWLHHVGGRSMREVAADLECSEGAAKVLVHRARRTLAERAIGLRGRWVSSSTFTVDTIARTLADRGVAHHVGAVVDDLLGQGGRWEFTVDDGRYRLRRDDGLELDRGSCWFGAGLFHFAPTEGSGEFALRVDIDAATARFGVAFSTTPPTKGVPDPVWAELFYSSAPFEFCGRPHLAA